MKSGYQSLYELEIGNFIDPSGESIKKAIENRWHVAIYYEDTNNKILEGTRIILPHTYGRGYIPSGQDEPINNHEYVRAFILRSSSVTKTDNRPYWRFFKVSRIKHWGIMRIKFKIRDGYMMDDKMLDKIISQIDENK